MTPEIDLKIHDVTYRRTAGVWMKQAMNMGGIWVREIDLTKTAFLEREYQKIVAKLEAPDGPVVS